MKFTVVSGAPCGLDDLEYLKNNADRNSKVIAADHGYETCKSAGIMPDIIVGDFDSASYPDYNCEIIKLPHEKDDTDTFYCVKEAVPMRLKFIVRSAEEWIIRFLILLLSSIALTAA